jgi:sporulation protein YlmC with PRC-barrel domain
MYFKRGELVDKIVIGADGNAIGTVTDILISLQGTVGLAVKTKNGEEIVVDAGDILTVGEYVLCKLNLTQAVEKHRRAKELSTTPQIPAAPPSPLPAAPATPPAPPQYVGPQPQAKGPTCPACGHVNPIGARFCERCGTRLA